MKRNGRRRLTRQEAEDALTFHLVVTARGCQVHDDPLDCEPPVQACHLIPKQALRRRGLYEAVWDTRNGLGACYKAHRRSDGALERFPAHCISAEARAFADELGLGWMLDKLYGEVAA